VAYGRTAVAPVSVSFGVANTGSRSGTIVPQLYLEFPPQSGEPSKVLANFARITLAAGQRRRISMPLRPRSFAYWSKGYKAWFVAPGIYKATVGSSVADVALRGDIQIVAK
jgi:beta-glucosidase